MLENWRARAMSPTPSNMAPTGKIPKRSNWRERRDRWRPARASNWKSMMPPTLRGRAAEHVPLPRGFLHPVCGYVCICQHQQSLQNARAWILRAIFASVKPRPMRAAKEKLRACQQVGAGPLKSQGSCQPIHDIMLHAQKATVEQALIAWTLA